MNQQNISALVWSIADLLRGPMKQSEYGKVILPFTILRRLDCVLAPTRAQALAVDKEKKAEGIPSAEFIKDAIGQPFYNLFPKSLPEIMGDPHSLGPNLKGYLKAFSEEVNDIFVRMDFETVIDRLDKSGLLYYITEKFANLDMHPDRLPNHQMGSLFEELLRKFSEMSNETAGEHFTPREVIQLMVELLFTEDDKTLSEGRVVRTIYDPTAGTGGMLLTALDYLKELNPKIDLTLYGQELNDESYAICKADMLMHDQKIEQIVAGDTLANDGHRGRKFDYMLSNPPFGVEWKKSQEVVTKEHDDLGYDGRFGPGLPRISDGSLLFLLHLLSKMRSVEEGGSRVGIVLNGSPLFTGSAGSGESEIRRYLLEQDYLEAIVALPTDMFFNTGIATYVWVLTNRKPEEKRGKVQLIDGSGLWRKMRKSLGSKRRELTPEHIQDITHLLKDGKATDVAVVRDAKGNELEQVVLFDGVAVPQPADGQKVKIRPISKIFNTTDFGYRTITVERPLRLRFQMTVEKLQAYENKIRDKLLEKPGKQLKPEENVKLIKEVGRLLDDAEAVYTDFGDQPYDDWNQLWPRIEKVLEARSSKYTVAQLKAFRDAFTESCPEAMPVKSGRKGGPEYEPDPSLRDTENVPLSEDVQAYFEREVLPYVPDAWIDGSKRDGKDCEVGIVGYEISFNRYFFVYEPPRSLAEIDAELKACTEEIVRMLGGMAV